MLVKKKSKFEVKVVVEATGADQATLEVSSMSRSSSDDEEEGELRSVHLQPTKVVVVRLVPSFPSSVKPESFLWA